jgi:hypothetical protein
LLPVSFNAIPVQHEPPDQTGCQKHNCRKPGQFRAPGVRQKVQGTRLTAAMFFYK